MDRDMQMASARTFLEALDPRAESFCFRALPDKRDDDAPSPKKFEGSLDSCFNDLVTANENGCGIFVVINEGGQKKEDISRVRAVFADFDTPGALTRKLIDEIKPHFWVKSSLGKGHCYWKVDDSFPLRAFGVVQSAISQKLSSDPNVKDLPRVMRLPGFKHLKGDPFWVEVRAKERSPFSLHGIVELLALDMNLHPVNPVNASNASAISLSELENILRHVPPTPDRDEWMKVLSGVSDKFGESGRELARAWSRGDLWKGGAGHESV